MNRLWIKVAMSAVLMCMYASEGTAQPKKSEVKRTTKPIRKSGTKNKPKTEVSAGIADYSSKNFLVHTDLPESEATELLERLEKMLSLVSGYYGHPNNQTIEMNVIDKRDHWPPGSIQAEAIGSIDGEAGVTMTVTNAIRVGLTEKQIIGAKSIVWCVASNGVPQHEAVHAYCHQNFGQSGPTWYSEGMAELGKYWREKGLGVQIDDYVLTYLKESSPKDLVEITAPGQQTGDSWKNYSWRWALCHLLSTNPNYSPRFKPLGMSLLNGHNATFEDVYGPMAKEISFEYLFFLENLGQGFRCDLCAWDWKTKFSKVKGLTTAQVKISANHGWQASRVLLKKGDKIAYSATGEWALKKGGEKIGPDGDESGQGRIIGVIFNDYQLSEVIELGGEGEFVAPTDGNLFIRCQDDLCAIEDNAGFVTVKFKGAP